MAKEKIRTGTIVTEYPTTPFLYERVPKLHNILIGNDPMQILFAEQFLSSFHGCKIECETVEQLGDDHIIGKEFPKLYRVSRSSLIELSPNVKSKVGVWSLDMLVKGSAGANAIVRKAAEILDIDKPKREVVEAVASQIVSDIDNVGGALWHAVWMLSGPIPEKKFWARPWENTTSWMPKGEDPTYRLNTLYWELITWVFATEKDEKGFRKTGRPFRPNDFKRLSNLKLDRDKVFATISALSTWRGRKYDPYVCALKIAKIWSGQ